MSNSFDESSLEIYHKSSYTWNLYYSETWNKWPYSVIFPKTKSKWRGMVNIFFINDLFKVNLLLNADDFIHDFIRIEYTLYAMQQNEIITEEKKKKIFLYKKEKLEDFKYFDFLTIPKTTFSPTSDCIQIRIIIVEEVSTPESTSKETNPTQEILEEYDEIRMLQEINTNEILKNNFKMMFDNKEFSDFVIKFNDSSEIPVHRCILAARSKVFSAMLKNDSSEKNEGYVKITDISKDTMILLLNFMYTGNITSDLSVEIAKNLLSAADKYDISDLKRICGKFLERNLAISNATDILLLSELHNVSELKNCVFEYILDNKDSFLDVVVFEEVGKKFPILLAEMMMKIFKDRI